MVLLSANQLQTPKKIVEAKRGKPQKSSFTRSRSVPVDPFLKSFALNYVFATSFLLGLMINLTSHVSSQVETVGISVDSIYLLLMQNCLPVSSLLMGELSQFTFNSFQQRFLILKNILECATVCCLFIRSSHELLVIQLSINLFFPLNIKVNGKLPCTDGVLSRH